MRIFLSSRIREPLKQDILRVILKPVLGSFPVRWGWVRNKSLITFTKANSLYKKNPDFLKLGSLKSGF